MLTSGAVAKKKAKEGALKSLEEAFVLLQLYANGAELLQVCCCCCGVLTWVVELHVEQRRGVMGEDGLGLMWCWLCWWQGCVGCWDKAAPLPELFLCCCSGQSNAAVVASSSG